MNTWKSLTEFQTMPVFLQVLISRSFLTIQVVSVQQGNQHDLQQVCSSVFQPLLQVSTSTYWCSYLYFVLLFLYLLLWNHLTPELFRTCTFLLQGSWFWQVNYFALSLANCRMVRKCNVTKERCKACQLDLVITSRHKETNSFLKCLPLM